MAWSLRVVIAAMLFVRRKPVDWQGISGLLDDSEDEHPGYKMLTCELERDVAATIAAALPKGMA